MDTAEDAIDEKNEVREVLFEDAPVEGIVGRIRGLWCKDDLAVGVGFRWADASYPASSVS
jgi:hypothetical protein